MGGCSPSGCDAVDSNDRFVRGAAQLTSSNLLSQCILSSITPGIAPFGSYLDVHRDTTVSALAHSSFPIAILVFISGKVTWSV